MTAVAEASAGTAGVALLQRGDGAECRFAVVCWTAEVERSRSAVSYPSLCQVRACGVAERCYRHSRLFAASRTVPADQTSRSPRIRHQPLNDLHTRRLSNTSNEMTC